MLDEFIEQVIAKRKLFLFHVRNEQALEAAPAHRPQQADHADFQAQLRQVFTSPSLPTLRVRLACSIGAVMGALMGAGDAFAEVPTAELAGMVAGRSTTCCPYRLANCDCRQFHTPTPAG